jgi:hypothetical protein
MSQSFDADRQSVLSMIASRTKAAGLCRKPMQSYYLLAIIFVWIPCGILSASLAQASNKPSWIWLIAGLIFGPIGLAGAMLLKEKPISS